jgi:hypothetical protein
MMIASSGAPASAAINPPTRTGTAGTMNPYPAFPPAPAISNGLATNALVGMNRLPGLDAGNPGGMFPAGVPAVGPAPANIDPTRQRLAQLMGNF